ncbi:site-2 protease family protein [Microvirga sp. W0021]|uniref:Site-2 protease family protein n=1 Tax=Hohaiivirga grylli TaxID=3133970 RepID=A0ABV0BL31_9HYPH
MCKPEKAHFAQLVTNPMLRKTSSLRTRHHISPSFIGLVAIMIISGVMMYNDMALSETIGPFLFVVSGWLIALCLHEFGHAIVAYKGGDKAVADTGYLTLDPLSYTHPVYSLLMPTLFIIMGFIALPGGAVYIRPSRLRSRDWQSAVSVAGPFMTLLCLCLTAVPFSLGLHKMGGTGLFWCSLALLAGFLAISLIWNLLPIPGLDGWGIIEPYLSYELQAIGHKWRQAGPTLLIIAVFLFRPLGQFVAKGMIAIIELMDIPSIYFFAGYQAFSLFK